MRSALLLLALIINCHAADIPEIDFEKIEFIGVGDPGGQKGVPHQSLKLVRQTGQAAEPNDARLEKLGYASVEGQRYRLIISDVKPSTESEEHAAKYKDDAKKFEWYRLGYYAGVRAVLKSNKGQFIAQAHGKSDDVRPWVDGYNDALAEIQALR